MRHWQLTGLVLAAATLFFTTRPAQAQVWIQPAPIMVAPAPVFVGPAPVVVGPGWGARPWGWGWGPRRYYRPYVRRAGWYGAAWGPRGRVWAGRRW
jgi:hypothetical protein